LLDDNEDFLCFVVPLERRHKLAIIHSVLPNLGMVEDTIPVLKNNSSQTLESLLILFQLKCNQDPVNVSPGRSASFKVRPILVFIAELGAMLGNGVADGLDNVLLEVTEGARLRHIR
jgi:hypothetical protein